MKNKKKKRSRVAPTKKEDKVVSATKSGEAKQNKRGRSCKSCTTTFQERRKYKQRKKKLLL